MRSSKYFKAMFTHDFAERNLPVIEIELDDEIDEDIFDSVVRIATSRTLKVSPETIEHFLFVADFFQIETLIVELERLIGRDTTQDIVGPFNVLDLWHLCLIHQPLKFIAGTLKLLIKNYLDAITADPSFLQLDSESVKTILMWDDLKISSEKKVFSAIKIWINHDPEQRKELYEKLLYCIRFDPDIDVSLFLINLCLRVIKAFFLSRRCS